MQVITISKVGMIHIPKKAMLKMGIKKGDKLILKSNCDSIVLVKPTILDKIDAYLSEVDSEIKELFYKEKLK